MRSIADIERDITQLKNWATKQGFGNSLQAERYGDIRVVWGEDNKPYIEASTNRGMVTSCVGTFRSKGLGRPELELTNLYVKNLFAEMFQVKQITGTNGDLLVSDMGIVENVTKTTITFKDPTNLGLCPFFAGDQLIIKRIKNDKTLTIKEITLSVTSVTGRTITVPDTGATIVGDIVVRTGNDTNPARSNLIYIAVNEGNSPFMDLYAGLTTATAYQTAQPKVRIGNLNGVTDSDFGGALTGYGAYLTNIYAKGKIYLADNGSISLGKTAYNDTTNAGFWLGDSNATVGVINPYLYLGSASDTKYLKIDTTAGTFNTLGFEIAAGAIKSTGTMTYDRAIAGTEYGYWLGKYNTNDYRFFIGSSATKYLKYDNSDLTFQGGYIQTSLRTDTTKDCIFIDGANNVLEFRKSGRSNATDYAVRITSAVKPGTYDIVGVSLKDGLFFTENTTTSSYAVISPDASIISLAGTLAYPTALTIYNTNSATDSTGLAVYSTGNGYTTYGISARGSLGLTGASVLAIGGNFEGLGGGASTTAYGIYANAQSGGTNWAGYFAGGNVYITNELQVGANKFTVSSTGQITKINNVITSGYVPISNGTHFEPRALTVSDVTNAVSTAGSYANPSWITSLDKSKITGLTASTICASTAGGVLTSTAFAPTILFDPATSYGEMIETNSSTTITMDGTNYVKFTGTATGLCGSGITYSATNDDLTVDSSVAGKYLVTYNVTAKADTAGEYYWGILLSGTVQNKTRQILNHTAINVNYSVSGSAILTLGDGDTIAIGCFGTNTRVVTVTYLNVNITKISN